MAFNSVLPTTFASAEFDYWMRHSYFINHTYLISRSTFYNPKPCARPLFYSIFIISLKPAYDTITILELFQQPQNPPCFKQIHPPPPSIYPWSPPEPVLYLYRPQASTQQAPQV